MIRYKLDQVDERNALLLEYVRKEATTMYSLRAQERFYLDDVKPGMVLAEPVLDRQGNRLLNSEMVLDDTKIERLRVRGVKSVRVKRDTTPVTH